jgi:hypothetical protein
MTPHGKSVLIQKRVEGRDELLDVQAPFMCDSCRKLSIAEWTEPYGDEQWDAGTPSSEPKMWQPFGFGPPVPVKWSPSPAERREFPDVPEPIASVATEAWLSFSVGAHRGALVLARVVLEASAKREGATVGNLVAKIKKLADDGRIRPHIVDTAHELRLSGNEIAHGDLHVDYPAEDAELVLTLMEEVLVELYQSPARVERAKAAREARKAKDTPPF